MTLRNVSSVALSFLCIAFVDGGLGVNWEVLGILIT